MTVFPWDSFGLASRFVFYFSENLRYYPETGSWMRCLSGSWEDCSEAEPERLAQQMIRMLPELEAGSYSAYPSMAGELSPREKFLRWCSRIRSRQAIRSTVKLARGQLTAGGIISREELSP